MATRRDSGQMLFQQQTKRPPEGGLSDLDSGQTLRSCHSSAPPGNQPA